MTQNQGNLHTIFVSYSHSDLELISPELERLDELGLSYWFDDGISLGSEWRDEVAQAISRSNIFLFFVSNTSVVSNHCLKELNILLNGAEPVIIDVPQAMDLRVTPDAYSIRHRDLPNLDKYFRKQRVELSFLALLDDI